MEPSPSAQTGPALFTRADVRGPHRRRGYAVPFQRPALPSPAAIERYFAASRAEGWYSNFGPCHDLLSERAGRILGGRPVVPVSSAGIGLIVALRALVPARG